MTPLLYPPPSFFKKHMFNQLSGNCQIRLWTLAILGIFASTAGYSQESDYRRREVSSFRLYGKITQSGSSLDLTLAAKNQNQIRATLHRPSHSARITVFYLNDTLVLSEDQGTSRTIHKMEKEEAARQLMELIALSPHYFFDNANLPIFDSSIFDDYILELKMQEIGYNSGQMPTSENKKPERMTLYIKETTEPIHTIEYISFLEDNKHAPQPSKLIIRNDKTKIESEIAIEKIEYNPGLPDFLFRSPKVKAAGVK